MSDFEFIVERLNAQGQAEAWLATAGNIQDARTLFGTMAALHPGQWIMLRQRAYVIASTHRAHGPEQARRGAEARGRACPPGDARPCGGWAPGMPS